MKGKHHPTPGEEVALSMSQFLSTELDIAGTLIHIAKSTDDSAKRTRCIFYARKAYDAIEEFLPKTPLSDSRIAEIRESLSCLKSQLDALGQNFHHSRQGLPASPAQLRPDPPKIRKATRPAPRSVNAYDDAVQEAKRFLIECQKVRAESNRMRAQNEVIMKRKRSFTAPV